jgi:hypothetical protein
MVVPTGRDIVVQITGADVIHSWFVPAFGVKQDAVPGRLTEKWFRVDEGNEGIYFGQCTELCGKDHAYMPITVNRGHARGLRALARGGARGNRGASALLRRRLRRVSARPPRRRADDSQGMTDTTVTEREHEAALATTSPCSSPA